MQGLGVRGLVGSLGGRNQVSLDCSMNLHYYGTCMTRGVFEEQKSLESKVLGLGFWTLNPQHFP